MSYSLNEIDALAKRAARGAGLSWGMSEEAGKAVRWLASHQLAGAAALAEILAQNDDIATCEIAPTSLDGIWKATSSRLCPLASGAALNDCAARLAAGEAIEMENVSHPLLVAPFAAWAAIQIGAPVAVTWSDVRIETDGYGIRVDDPSTQIDVASVERLSCSRVKGQADAVIQPAQRGEVSSSVWSCLSVYAHRTYAPATEESRLLGAGAGVFDND